MVREKELWLKLKEQLLNFKRKKKISGLKKGTLVISERGIA
jgi:hypothetical protein